jgi:hypothetical protein
MAAFRLFRHAELVSASISPVQPKVGGVRWTLKQVQGDEGGEQQVPSNPIQIRLDR